jgi:hypothetical protein
LYARVIFFPPAVDGLVEQLGDVEPVHHRRRSWQQRLTGVVERLGHVRPVRPHPAALTFAEFFQAFPGGGFVAALGHGQHLGVLRVGQVGQDGDEPLVPLLQAQLVDAHVGDDPRRIDRLGAGVGELVADDQLDHLGGDAEPAGHLGDVAADQERQHMLLEAEGVAGVLALERRDEGLAAVTVRAAVEGGLVDPEAGLAPDVEVADDLHAVLGLQLGGVLLAAAVAADAAGQGPGHFEAVALAVALVRDEGHTLGEIDVDGDSSHDPTAASLRVGPRLRPRRRQPRLA